MDKIKKVIDFYDGDYIYKDEDGYWSGHAESDTVGKINPDVALNIIFDKIDSIVVNKQTINDDCEKLKKQLEDERKYSKRLNLEAQRWFDMSMELMHK